MKYKVFLIGNGGRESAIAYSLRKSNLLDSLKVYIGNASFKKEEIVFKETFNIQDKQDYQNFIRRENFDLVVVGPEQFLVDGICDWTEEVDILCFGPNKGCSQIESSKEFAKQLMKEAKVSTADYEIFDIYTKALSYLKKQTFPLVVKLDGLAAGKGVSVCKNIEEAEHFLKEIFIKLKFGKNPRVLIEECITGFETSVFALCDGKNYVLFPPSQDHKRAYDNDQGPNTGGMGAFCPTPKVLKALLKKISKEVFDRIFSILIQKKQFYRGLLYAGLMIDQQENIKVLEFNCRFGDPETQVVLPLLEDDLLDLMLQVAKGHLKTKKLNFKKESSCCVVVAAEGYPNSYKKNIEINLDESKEFLLFYAGAKNVQGRILSDGGRILSIVSTDKNLNDAKQKVYTYLSQYNIKNTFFRTDIAKDF